MPNDLCLSYSFSFQLKICQDIRYFKKTTQGNTLNDDVEKFILNFIDKNVKYTIANPPRGRPNENKIIKDIDKYTSFQFSLKTSIIKKIKQHKHNGNMPNLDKNLEEYLRLRVPVRVVR